MIKQRRGKGSEISKRLGSTTQSKVKPIVLKAIDAVKPVLDERSSRPEEHYASESSSRESSRARTFKPFRFFNLPAELRVRIYEHRLLVPDVVDLNPLNYRRLAPRLALLLVNRQMHEEAYRIFYAQTLRLFPNSDRFFHTKKALVERLPPRYRNEIMSMELRLGPGWTSPPRCQNTKPTLGLADCHNLKLLKIFIELDPSDNVFAGFRGKNATEDTYKWFCVDLLSGILEQVPSLVAVEIDAYPSVKKDAPMVIALQRRIAEAGKALLWGPLRGWDKDADEPGLIGLEAAMSSLGISSGMVEVQA